MLVFSHFLTLKIPITKKNLKSYYFFLSLHHEKEQTT